MRIAVVGAGVIGLTSAVAIKEAFPSDIVTIFADVFTPGTTGDGSAGLWGPYILDNTPADNIIRWSEKTHKWMEQFWRSDIASDIGVSLFPVIRLMSDDKNEHVDPPWISIVYGGRKLTLDELHVLNTDYKKNYSLGYHFLTFTCEPKKLLPWLTKKFILLGGQVKQRSIQSLEGLQSEDYDVIINCSGLGALNLANDPQVTPVRGQVIRVEAPWIYNSVLEDDDDGNYVIPNIDSVILGGTHQKGDFDISVREEDTQFIYDGCSRMFPSLKNSKILNHWVGLRPGRSEVRLEAEILKSQTGQDYLIIHNYGHGGSGVTLCWGCASDVVDMLRQKRSLLTSHL